jgi:hypothetical protein
MGTLLLLQVCTRMQTHTKPDFTSFWRSKLFDSDSDVLIYKKQKQSGSFFEDVFMHFQTCGEQCVTERIV